MARVDTLAKNTLETLLDIGNLIRNCDVSSKIGGFQVFWTHTTRAVCHVFFCSLMFELHGHYGLSLYWYWVEFFETPERLYRLENVTNVVVVVKWVKFQCWLNYPFKCAFLSPYLYSWRCRPVTGLRSAPPGIVPAALQPWRVNGLYCSRIARTHTHTQSLFKQTSF